MQTLIMIALLSTNILGATPQEATVTGTVVSADGKPLRAAHVYVYAATPRVGNSVVCPTCYRECGKQVDPTLSGDFKIAGLDPELNVRLLAVADGYEPALSEYVDPHSSVPLTLSRRKISDEGHLIRGRVVDPDGKIVVGAIVEPSGLHFGKTSVGFGNFPGLDKLSITDAAGEFVLKIPDEQSPMAVVRDSFALDVRVRARNFAPTIARALLAGQVRTVMVTPGAAVVGRVVHDGKPVSDKRVRFVQCDRNSEYFLGVDEIGTDKDGVFTMTGLGPNTEYVVFLTDDVAPLATPRKPVMVGGDDTSVDIGTIELTPGFRVSGRLVKSGQIPPHTRVMLDRDQAWDGRVVEVKPDGTFEFNGVPAENVHLLIRGAGPALSVDRDIENVVIELE